MKIVDFEPSMRDAWDGFVHAHPDATFFHLGAWAEIIRNVFGHRSHYLVAEQDGAIAGVLPLVHVRSLLFGSSMVSTPFCVRGGALAASDEIATRLVEAAVARADAQRVGQLELKGAAGCEGDGWLQDDLYFNFSREISADHDANMKAIPRKQRAMVRKGINHDLVSEVTDDVDGFFRIYAESVRGLGTPVFARRYFHELKRVFGEACDVTTVSHQGVPCASVMSFYFRDTVLPYYGGGTTLAREVKGYDFMYWELMRRSADRGLTRFDYGRSKRDTGAFSFKKNWGFEPEPLDYRYRLVQATAMAQKNPSNPKYRTFIEAWKRLPLPIANRLGPMIARDLG